MRENQRVAAPRNALAREKGAVVIGGDYRALGVVRSLGRRGIPVLLVIDDHWLAASSRFVHDRARMPAGGDLAKLQFLLRLAEERDLEGWTLIPTNDDAAQLSAHHHARLGRHFLLTVPPWDTLRWAHDKRFTYALAERIGVAYPWTLAPGSADDLWKAAGHFPVLVKPAFKPTTNAFTAAKAWRADDRESLAAAYRAACELVPADAVLVQEFVRGSGASQYSYAALVASGRPIASITARRVRQWPMSIGRASTYVETVNDAAVERAAELLLATIDYTGLVEIEFKKDESGTPQLLDINPRVWGWHSIGRRAGVDFPYLLWRLVHREPLEEIRGRVGIRWMRFMTDFPMAFREMLGGRLSPASYLDAFAGRTEFAIFAKDDPMPALFELPMIAQLLLRRRGV